MLNFKTLFNQLLPAHCLFCDSVTALKNQQTMMSICATCLANLPWRGEECCPQCALGIANTHCGSCLKKAPYFDYTLTVCKYQYPIDAVLQAFKYQHQLSLCAPLAQLLSQVVKQQVVDLTEIDLIVPMPMHSKRLQARGFNQSLEIAKIVSKHLAIPVDSSVCTRVIDTPPQASLALKARAKNIKGAFKCSDQVGGLRIAVIDDVMTSGASLNELAKSLKKAGAICVSNWVVARTL